MNAAASKICLSLFLIIFAASAYAQETAPTKTVALGDVDAGYDMSGGKAYSVKEDIQIGLKKEIEKYGKGRLSVKITSPAVVAGGSEAAGSVEMPVLPADRMPTQAEISRYMAEMQKWQKIQSGQLKVHSPVAADYFFDFKVQSGESGVDTGGAASTLGSLTGLDTSIGQVSTKSSKVYLVCTQRDPATGVLQDRHTAKASSVKVKNLGGYTSYDYGDNSIARQRLFDSAIKQCARWIASVAK